MHRIFFKLYLAIPYNTKLREKIGFEVSMLNNNKQKTNNGEELSFISIRYAQYVFLHTTVWL